MDRTMLGRGLMAIGAILVLAGAVGLVVGGDDDPVVAEVAPPVSTEAPATTPADTENPTSTSSSSTSTSTTTSSSTSTTTTSTTTSTTTTSTTTPPAEVETSDTFFALFLAAFADNDPDTLFDRLNPATLERYGESQCRTYVDDVAGTAQDLTIRETSPEEEWDYRTDDVSASVTDVLAVEVERIVNGQTLIQELHWQLVDGRFTWFSDCGEPVGA